MFILSHVGTGDSEAKVPWSPSCFGNGFIKFLNLMLLGRFLTMDLELEALDSSVRALAFFFSAFWSCQPDDYDA